jgi:hypothetical protein
MKVEKWLTYISAFKKRSWTHGRNYSNNHKNPKKKLMNYLQIWIKSGYKNFCNDLLISFYCLDTRSFQNFQLIVGNDAPWGSNPNSEWAINHLHWDRSTGFTIIKMFYEKMKEIRNICWTNGNCPYSNFIFEFHYEFFIFRIDLFTSICMECK